MQLRQRDQDMHKVLKVALQPWPTLAGKDALVDFGVYNRTRESYFRVDHFCKDKHEDVVHRHKLRKLLIVQIKLEEAVLFLLSSWTGSFMTLGSLVPLQIWTMGWSLVHPVC